VLGLLGIASTFGIALGAWLIVLWTWLGLADSWTIDPSNIWDLAEPWALPIMMLLCLYGMWRYWKT